MCSFPSTLEKNLELKYLLFCGRQVSIDFIRTEDLGVCLVKRFQLINAALCDKPRMSRVYLENVTARFLGLSLDKVHCDECFSACSLPVHVQRYSSLGILVSRKLGESLPQTNLDQDCQIKLNALYLEIGGKVKHILVGKVAGL